MGRRKNDELPSRLDRSTAEYLRNLEKAMYNNAISSEDQWESMLNSAFEEIKGTEYETCGDVVGSRVVERLLRYSVDQKDGHPFMPNLVVEHFQELLRIDRYWDVFGDKYGSHVAQTLFELVGKLLGPESELSSTLKTALVDQIVAIAKDMRDKWIDLMQDCYASHVGRSLIQLLAGKTGDEKKEPLDADAEAAAAAARRPELLKEVPLVAEAIFGGDGPEVAGQVRDMGYGSYSVPILQLLMRVHPDTDAVAKRALGWVGPTVSVSSECGEHIVALLTDSAGSHLLETVIGALSDESYYELYVTFFRGQLLELALDPVANFVVQQLLKHARIPAHVVSLVGELTGDDNGAAMRQLFEGQRSSTILAAVKACEKHKAQQAETVKAVAAALDATGSGGVSSKFLEALLGLKESASRDLGGRDIGSGARAVVKKKRKRSNTKGDAISSIGAQIVQGILMYHPDANTILVNSFLAAPNHYLASLCTVPAGSRLMETFLSCPAHKLARTAAGKKSKGKTEESKEEVAAARLQKFIDRFCAHHIHAGGDPADAAPVEQPQKRQRGRNRDTEDGGASAMEAEGEDEDEKDPGENVVVSLAKDKFGSRVVEALYSVAELKRKRKIVGHLAACKAELEADFHGRITLSKCRVGQFAAPKGGEEAWAEREASVAKKKAMFAEILEDSDDEAAGAGEESDLAAKLKKAADPLGLEKLDGATKDIVGQLGVQRRAAGGEKAKGGTHDEIDDLFASSGNQADDVDAAGGGGDGAGEEEDEVVTISTGKKKKKKEKGDKKKKSKKSKKEKA